MFHKKVTKKCETFYNKILKVHNPLSNLVFRLIGCVNILNKDCADANFQNWKEKSKQEDVIFMKNLVS